MSGSTTKKVIVERFEREPLRGFVNPQTWLLAAGVEVLTTEGNIVVAPFDQVKVVIFVKDIDGPRFSGERRSYSTRPKNEGLWVRMLFRDGDHLDGLLPNNLLGLEAQGFTVAPPDPGSNAQRIFAPKAGLTAIKVLGVIGGPLRRRKRVPPSEDQIRLFD